MGIAKDKEYTHSKLFGLIKAYLSAEDVETVGKAYKFSEQAHHGQKRKDGSDYIVHPLSVAIYLAQIGADTETLCSALLHDCVEDTSVSLSQVKKLFGTNIAKLVDGLTKLHGSQYKGYATLDAKIESLRKWFEIMKKDMRVAIVKIVDRLHNMETIEAHKDPDKIRAKAEETMNLYVLICKRFGLNTWADKLSELCFKVLSPEDYLKIEKEFDGLYKKDKKVFSSFEDHLKKIDEDHLVVDEYLEDPSHFFYFNRNRHYFSPNPMKASEDKKFDSTIVNIVVRDSEDCYKVLYLIHSNWQYLRNTFKDFISTPYVSGYQALHTRIIDQKGNTVLVKIRTKEMDEYSKHGVAYKLFTQKEKPNLSWLDNIEPMLKESDWSSFKFMSGLEKDILNKYIYIYGPKGDSYYIPINSTALDAAFLIEGKQTYKLSSVSVNGAVVPLEYIIKDSDHVVFAFGRDDTISKYWSTFIRTSMSKLYLHEYFENKPKDHEMIRYGKSILNNYLADNSLGLISELKPEVVENILKITNKKIIEDLYLSIALGEVDVSDIRNIIRPSCNKPRMFMVEVIGDPSHIPTVKDNPAFTIEKMHLNFVKGALKTTSEYKIKACLNADDLHQKLKMMLKGDYNISIADITSKHRFILAVLLLVVIWTLDPFIARGILKEGMDPFQFTFIRMITGSFILFFYTYYLSRKYSYIDMYSIKPYNIPIFIGGSFLLMLALFTYLSLNTFSPIVYVLVMHFSLPLILLTERFYKTGKWSFKSKLWIQSLQIIPLALIFYYLYIGFGWRAIFPFMACLGFTLYTIHSNITRSENNINLRSVILSFRFHAVSLIFSAIILFGYVMFNNVTWNSGTVLNGILFSAVFNFLPLAILASEPLRKLHMGYNETALFHFILIFSFFIQYILNLFNPGYGEIYQYQIVGGLMIILIMRIYNYIGKDKSRNISPV